MNRTYVFAGVVCTVFMTAVEATVVATAMPSLIADLGRVSLYGWVSAAYLLASTVTVPLYGRLADVHGRKPVMLFGVALFIAGSAASGAAWNTWVLIIARVVQGLGAGAIQPTATTIIGDMYTLEERGRIQAWLGSVWALAGAAGPLLGGFVVAALSWRWVFWFNLPFGIAAYAVLQRYHVESLQRGGAQSSPRALLAQPLVISGALLSASVGGIMMGFLTYAPLYVQGVLSASPATAGSVVTPMLVTWPLVSALTALRLRRVGFRVPVLVGFFIAGTATLAAAILVPRVDAMWPWWIASLLLGAGLGMCVVTITVALQASVPWYQRGAATALITFTRSLGAAVCVGGMGALLTARLSTMLDPERIGPLLSPDPGRLATIDATARAALAASFPPLLWTLVVVGALSLVMALLYRPPAPDAVVAPALVAE